MTPWDAMLSMLAAYARPEWEATLMSPGDSSPPVIRVPWGVRYDVMRSIIGYGPEDAGVPWKMGNQHVTEVQCEGWGRPFGDPPAFRWAIIRVRFAAGDLVRPSSFDPE